MLDVALGRQLHRDDTEYRIQQKKTVGTGPDTVPCLNTVGIIGWVRDVCPHCTVSSGGREEEDIIMVYDAEENRNTLLLVPLPFAEQIAEMMISDMAKGINTLPDYSRVMFDGKTLHVGEPIVPNPYPNRMPKSVRFLASLYPFPMAEIGKEYILRSTPDWPAVQYLFVHRNVTKTPIDIFMHYHKYLEHQLDAWVKASPAEQQQWVIAIRNQQNESANNQHASHVSHSPEHSGDGPSFNTHRLGIGSKSTKETNSGES